MWLGVTEYLFRTPGMLDEAIDTAIVDHTFRDDDLEFTFAARVSLVSPLLYLCSCNLAMNSPVVSSLLTCSRAGLNVFLLAPSKLIANVLGVLRNTLPRVSPRRSSWGMR